MTAYAKTDGCLMSFLRHQLDDDPGEACGRCANCLGRLIIDVTPSPETQGAALEFLRRSHIPIDPRKRWPPGVKLASPAKSGCEEGRSLSVWGDPGWAELVRRGKYQDDHFEDSLATAVANMVLAWNPQPTPTWVTAVPSSGSTDLVPDIARRIASALSLPFELAVSRTQARPAQKTMQNSAQQFRNTLGAFEVNSPRPGPVLLVDDMVDSRWTFTMIGHLLRESGCEAVFPVALVDTSRAAS
jgi:ATP-dependent DNA helicase RecQ